MLFWLHEADPASAKPGARIDCAIHKLVICCSTLTLHLVIGSVSPDQIQDFAIQMGLNSNQFGAPQRHLGKPRLLNQLKPDTVSGFKSWATQVIAGKVNAMAKAR